MSPRYELSPSPLCVLYSHNVPTNFQLWQDGQHSQVSLSAMGCTFGKELHANQLPHVLRGKELDADEEYDVDGGLDMYESRSKRGNQVQPHFLSTFEPLELENASVLFLRLTGHASRAWRSESPSPGPCMLSCISLFGRIKWRLIAVSEKGTSWLAARMHCHHIGPVTQKPSAGSAELERAAMNIMLSRANTATRHCMHARQLNISIAAGEGGQEGTRSSGRRRPPHDLGA